MGGGNTIYEAKYYLNFLRIQPSEVNKYIFNPSQSNSLGEDSDNRDLWLLGEQELLSRGYHFHQVHAPPPVHDNKPTSPVICLASAYSF